MRALGFTSSAHPYKVSIGLDVVFKERILDVLTDEKVKNRYLEILSQLKFPRL